MTNKMPKNADIFSCSYCDFRCSKKSNWDKHLLTRKHQIVTNGYTKVAQNAKQYFCECGNSYNHRQNLYTHKKKCKIEQSVENDTVISDEPTDKELMMMVVKQNAELIKDNSELKTIIMEVVKNGTMQNSHNTTTNSHNKAFNLNFFLNETCKDAMNITDFVESIQLQLSDLERVGELGYVEGISNIIVKNLKDLDVTQRPVHCTDKKRETMYVKDEDKWEKDEENSKIKKVIKKVASKNQRLLPKFKEVHPDCMTYHSKYSDQYNKLIVESMGGSGDNDTEKEEKIIRNISKIVSVDK
jgi:hypothetical protein